MLTLTDSPAWKKLKLHKEIIENLNLRDLFANNTERFEDFSLQAGPIFLDYSKNLMSNETMSLLFELARQEKVEQYRDAMFSGQEINFTEHRSVLHTALRNQSTKEILSQGKNVKPEINAVLEKMEKFSEQVREGQWLGYTGKAITDVVNIGIGGSDLGPKMVIHALKPFTNRKIKLHFVSNLDGSQMAETLTKLNPETTLFIISSKTFTTQETMFNAVTARGWFVSRVKNKDFIKNHFVAVSTNSDGVQQFGIDQQNIFEFWDWVGGRYSLWSAIGLSITIAIGMENYKQLLAGAAQMDEHFAQAPLEENMPVILALLGILHNNFFAVHSHAVMVYDHYLSLFPTFLQQLDMESNGKHVNRDGEKVDYRTGPVIWGEQGINGQHAFYQLLHQGTSPIPCDFLIALDSYNPACGHHPVLMSNCFAQSEALMRGKTEAEARQEMQAEGLSEDEIEKLLPHKIFEGNRSSNSILFKDLTPNTLGSLIALYEHKVFVQGVIWRLNSFDQWGVQLGKQLANQIQLDLANDEPVVRHDSSTNGLINYYKRNRNSEGNTLLSYGKDWSSLQEIMEKEFESE
ncbi:MAG: glucose-6-phosphate isomerase [Gammaproteobacteria bacterium]|nr:glucose-6-phosphate isomerase [Gammaproteobacteria bacterium]